MRSLSRRNFLNNRVCHHTPHTRWFLCLLLLLSCSCVRVFAQGARQADAPPPWFNGITLEDVLNLRKEQRDALDAIKTVVVVRVVFAANTEPEVYKTTLDDLRGLKLPDGQTRKVYIMGELLDSDFLARYRWDCKESEGCSKGEDRDSKYHDYKTRVDRYMTALDKQVDIWEVGNEVNGEWADEGCVKKSNDSCVSDVKEEKDATGKKTKSVPQPSLTAQKVAYALEVATGKGKPVALTLINQPECTTWDANTMFGWATANLRPLVNRYKIDYLLISYYEDNCDGGRKTIAPKKQLTKEERKKLSDSQQDQRRREIYWNKTFDDLQSLFSQVEHVGFGEVGYSSDMKTCADDVLSYCKGNSRAGSKLDLLNRYYGMNITNRTYVGGHFWWEAQEDIAYKGFYSPLTSFFKVVNGPSR